MKITRLFIYPIKSCAAVEVEQLTFDQNGPVGDRRYMLVDNNGRFLTQRTLPAMAHIYPRIEENVLIVDAEGQPTLRVTGQRAADGGRQLDVSVWKDSLPAQDCGDEAAAWFEAVLGRACRLVQLSDNTQRQVNRKYAEAGEWVGFADGYPLLVTTEESLDVLSQAVGRPLDMLRFRPNIVLAGAPAFAEQTWQALNSENGGLIKITKPCERCVIPTRDIATQQREGDMLAVMKQHCLIDGKIIFGQNALARKVSQLTIGELLTPVSE